MSPEATTARAAHAMPLYGSASDGDMAGEDDPVSPVASTRRVACSARHPALELHVFPGVGHDVFRQAQTQAFALFRAFLQELPPARRTKPRPGPATKRHVISGLLAAWPLNYQRPPSPLAVPVSCARRLAAGAWDQPMAAGRAWLRTGVPGKQLADRAVLVNPLLVLTAVPAIHRAVRQGGVLIIDELGQMELLSPAFTSMPSQPLDQPVPLVATIHARVVVTRADDAT